MKKIILSILIIFLITGISYADEMADEIINSQKEELDIGGFIEESDKYTKEVFKDIDMGEMLNSAIKGKIEKKSIFSGVINLLGSEIKNTFNVLGSILIIVIIHSILKTISENLQNKSVSKITYYVQYILIATLILNNFSDIISSTKEAVNNMTGFIHVLIPLLVTLVATTGSIVSANIMQPVILVAINLISNLFQNVFLPIILVSTALIIISKISDQVQIGKLSKFLNSSVVWIIGIVLTIFVSILSLEGTLGSSVDGVSVKIAKSAVSNFVPVVGKILGDTVDTVLGCSNILKNAVGTVGIIVIVSICLKPVVKLVILSASYSLVSALCEPIADKKIVELLQQIGNTFKILLAIVTTISVMLIIGIALVMKISNSGIMYR